MTFRRAGFMAVLIGAGLGPALAQFPPVPQQQQAPVAQPQSAQPMQPQMQLAQPPAQQGPPPCVVEFLHLRDDTEKKGKAIQAASQRHATPKEACPLFVTFTAAEAKLIKYAIDNGTWCGIPPQFVEQLKKGHEQAMQLRTKVCQAAANQQQMAPRAPTLSDALAPPVTDQSNIKTGRGTFDTLTGTPLGQK